MPTVHQSAYLAPTAIVEGDVNIGAASSVWHHTVLRADLAPITIGARTNIQDGAILHVSTEHPVLLGDDVTVGHGAIVHGCTVGSCSLVGMGAIVLDGAEIGDHCIVGAGSLVTKGKVIPNGTLALGSPARVVRKLRPEEYDELAHNAAEYVRLAQQAIEREAPQPC